MWISLQQKIDIFFYYCLQEIFQHPVCLMLTYLFSAVHIMLTDLLPDHLYYRFNPYLTEHVSMVEIDDSKLEQLRRDAIMYLRRNDDKFQEVAKALTKKKSIRHKIKDFVKEKSDSLGLWNQNN